MRRANAPPRTIQQVVPVKKPFIRPSPRAVSRGGEVYKFLVEAVRAHFAGKRAPSLLPQPP